MDIFCSCRDADQLYCYFVPKVVRSKGKEKSENVWIIVLISIFLLPFIIYAIVEAVNFHADIKGDLYNTYEGRFQIVSIYTDRSADVKADVKFLKDGKYETYVIHPDADDKLDVGVYDGFVVYSEKTDYIFDWGENSAQ